MAKYSQEDKEAYLKYYKKNRKNKKTDTFSSWMKKREVTGSKQHSRGMRGLSGGDYAEILKMMDKNKRGK